ncbi:hypothetical protein L226DRAFT_549338 [Lentinus tigrinus ALCF2SS1-7]|uniref:uncharacterized protein n=1 Tax=Lentinus tigrinus ALCF2SS1-7 TaxID=1328758 RepID=UPI001166165A|nr:hypothetical protein L226DRAFT_549338 [Lentinus tigrinus ALCF2SS1-7]
MASDPTAAFPLIPVDNTLGAWLLGVAGSFLLNGTIFHQAIRYYRQFPKDRLLLKLWVAAVVVLETFTSALILHTAYFYLIQKYWEPTYFFVNRTVWSINLLPIPGSIAALTSQFFFARRVWMSTRPFPLGILRGTENDSVSPKFRLLVAVAIVLITGNVGCFTALSIKMFNSQTVADWLAFSWLASLGSCVQMAGDMMMTGTLIFVLRQSRTGINRTDSMLDLLITYAVTTGVITCVVHILNVAFAIKYPDNFIYAALSCILTKLYANTFLAALNTRKSLGILGATGESATPYHNDNAHRLHHGGNGPMNMPNLQMSAGTSQPTAIELKVVTEVITDDDQDELDRRPTKRVHIRGREDMDLMTP